MTRKDVALALASALCLMSGALPRGSAQEDTGGPTLSIEVLGLRSERGVFRGGLYTEARRWLDEHATAADCVARIHGGRALCVFRGVHAARVAFVGMHDEDDDGELDRDLFGIPQEGYAFSNDARPSFGPPSFDDAAFRATRTRVTVRYGL